jgi:hypothetical protein
MATKAKRLQAGPNEMRLMFTSLHNQLGTMTEEAWNALPKQQQEQALANATAASGMNPRTVNLRNWAALRHKGLNNGYHIAVLASSVAYAVGYISYATHKANVESFQVKTTANAQ